MLLEYSQVIRLVANTRCPTRNLESTESLARVICVLNNFTFLLNSFLSLPPSFANLVVKFLTLIKIID